MSKKALNFVLCMATAISLMCVTGCKTSSNTSSNRTAAGNSNQSSNQSYIQAEDMSDKVFTSFAGYAHSYETQPISLIGMTPDEASNYDTTYIYIPSEMVGEDKKFVGSINPSGTTFKWASGHNSDVAPVNIGDTKITVRYGDNSTLKEYLSQFSNLYSKISKRQVVEYDSSKYTTSSSAKKAAEPSFKELCQQSYQYIGAVPGNEK